MRCDELHYFVEDVKKDLDRAMSVFGRRAAVYAINYAVTQGTPLGDYEYQNCTPFLFDGNGSEAAIAELVVCGTLNGNNVIE